jgi:hypothetical protein
MNNCPCVFMCIYIFWCLSNICPYILLFSIKRVLNYIDQVFTVRTLSHTYHAAVMMYRNVRVHCLIVSLIYLYHKLTSVCTLRVVQGSIERIVYINLTIIVASYTLFKQIIEHNHMFQLINPYPANVENMVSS